MDLKVGMRVKIETENDGWFTGKVESIGSKGNLSDGTPHVAIIRPDDEAVERLLGGPYALGAAHWDRVEVLHDEEVKDLDPFHWSDNEIFLDFEGNPISVFGVAVEGAQRSGVTVHYKGAKSVTEAQGVHAAWLAWKDASRSLGKKSSPAEEQRVRDLRATYERLVETLGTFGA